MFAHHVRSQNTDYDAIVVGSGIGGLSAAAILGRLHGLKTVVLERHNRAGGMIQSFSRPPGYAFDIGLQNVGEMGTPGRPRNVMSVITGGKVTWLRMSGVLDRLVFPDFEFAIRDCKSHFLSDLIDAFPSEVSALQRYFVDIDHAVSWRNIVAMRSLAPRPVTWALSNILAKRGRLASVTTRDYIDANFQDPQLRAILGARWGNFGLPPATSSFFIHALVTKHYLDGASYPKGSAPAVTRAAEAVINEAGGELRTNAEVEEILVRSGQVVGVRLRTGEVVRSSLVISDVGAHNTFLRLLDESIRLPFRTELEQIRPSSSHVCLFLGLSGSPATLGVRGETTWIYESLDHDHIWAQLSQLCLGRPVTASITFPSMRDPDCMHTAQMIIPVEVSDFSRWAGTERSKRGGDYQSLKERMADGLIAAVDRVIPGLSQLVAYRELSTPLTTANYCGHPHGQAYGIAYTPSRLALDWLQPRTPIPGLFLTGSDALVCGVAGAAVSGLVCAAAIAGPSTFTKLASEARRIEQSLAAASSSNLD